MAFKKKTESNSNPTNQLPYLNVLISLMDEKALKKFDGSLHPIKSISYPKSGKGVMVVTDLFSAFFWKGSNYWDELESWLVDFDLDGQIFVCIDLKTKVQCELGTDSDYQCEVLKKNESSYVINQIPKSIDSKAEKN